LVGGLGETEGLANLARDIGFVLNGFQGDEGDAVGVVADDVFGYGHGEAGFPDSAEAGEGHEAGPTKERSDFDALVLSADEVGERMGEAPREDSGGSGGRLSRLGFSFGTETEIEIGGLLVWNGTRFAFEVVFKLAIDLKGFVRVSTGGKCLHEAAAGGVSPRIDLDGPLEPGLGGGKILGSVGRVSELEQGLNALVLSGGALLGHPFFGAALKEVALVDIDGRLEGSESGGGERVFEFDEIDLGAFQVHFEGTAVGGLDSIALGAERLAEFAQDGAEVGEGFGVLRVRPEKAGQPVSFDPTTLAQDQDGEEPESLTRTKGREFCSLYQDSHRAE